MPKSRGRAGAKKRVKPPPKTHRTSASRRPDTGGLANLVAAATGAGGPRRAEATNADGAPAGLPARSGPARMDSGAARAEARSQATDSAHADGEAPKLPAAASGSREDC